MLACWAWALGEEATTLNAQRGHVNTFRLQCSLVGLRDLDNLFLLLTIDEHLTIILGPFKSG